MTISATHPRRGFTLFEVLMVVALLVLLSMIVLPDYLKEMEEARLPNSADQLRSMVFLTRTHAMVDGKRYRLRFRDVEMLSVDSEEGELALDELSARQPVVERESDDPDSFGEWLSVKEPWALGVTLHRGIRCAGVRLGRPMFRAELEESLAAEMEGEGMEEESKNDETRAEDSLYPALVFEPDGTCDWATIVLTDAAEEISLEELSSDGELDAEVLEVIVDGRTGQAWLQRLLSEDEEALLKEYGLPPVLRQDFLSAELLTEDNVREISEGRARR